MQSPFIGTEALTAGVVNRYQLATRYDALFRNVYVPKGQPVTPVDKAIGAWLWSGRRSTAAGLSAAALLGSKWIDVKRPAELNHSSRHKTPGILLHSDALTQDEVCTVKGIATTTAARTAFDLGRRREIDAAVVAIDALRQATRLDPAAVAQLMDRHRGERGIMRLRQAMDLSDPGAESPQETRTRLILTRANLRPPETQIDVLDGFDHVGRIDMGWLAWKVGVEYDGIQHWTDPSVRNRDIARQVKLEELGWRIIRVNADMLRYEPWLVVSRTRIALRAAGADV